MIQPSAKRALFLGTLFLGLAVLIGAFGAHALKSMVTPERLITFETGVRYQFYHGFALILLGFFGQQFSQIKINVSLYAFVVGILLFSFNCYFYVLSDIKIFAILIPVGGLLFVLGWMMFAWNVLRVR